MNVEEILKQEYVNAIEAAEMLNVNDSRIRQLCIGGKLASAFKIGDTWLIPRTSVLNYKPGKRGPKSKPSIKDTILDVVNNADNLKVGELHDQQ